MGTGKSLDHDDYLEMLSYFDVAVACLDSPAPVRSSGQDK